MTKDILFDTDDYRFGIRTVGVTVRDGKILVQREMDGNEYALPGGTVKFGETTVETLIREYYEEIGSDIIIKKLLWTEESFWEYNGKKQHGIAFYYLIDLLDDAIFQRSEFVSQKDNCNVVLGWMPVNDLENIIIYPEFVKEEIHRINEPTKHFISKQELSR
ncbi:MAG: NUDIX domain-containing protein [Clostridia bacterium]|nr:NUDIX domain-containing protein [Clostridia bacterium]